MSFAGHPHNHHASVLVVEDDRRLRDIYLTIIRQLGFRVSAVRSAEEATELLKSESADILLLDINLPGESGIDFLQRLRQNGLMSEVVFMTGYGDLEMARRAIRLDVVDFLTKPAELADIQMALERACKRHLDRVASNTTLHDSVPVVPGPMSTDGLTLSELERHQIASALARHRGNRTAAARELGISRRTLHYRLVEYRRNGIEIE